MEERQPLGDLVHRLPTGDLRAGPTAGLPVGPTRFPNLGSALE